ncbi:MAG: hypothetical protein EXS46_01375 [Candidatus Taylorbacteria bacterium]|nr:hypothetical protein [Candidatus Taylorbacteria bacterium]
MKRKNKVYLISVFGAVVTSAVLFFSFANNYKLVSWHLKNQIASIQNVMLPEKDELGNVLYKGAISHIFFHSLIVYPKLAFDGGPNNQVYKDYMITRDDFQKILPELYKNNYILIDIKSLYDVGNDGSVERKVLYLPVNKKPLVISLDDQSYYSSMKGHGFADKLVLDKNGNVSTQIITPEGITQVTRDGDVVPILDDFVSAHPNFSFKGAKGVIAVTGFEGILGYRTDYDDISKYPLDLAFAKVVINKLKATGWRFASHSYTHSKAFSTDSITLENLKNDTEQWDREVKSLVGDTDIFVGPFGDIFKSSDPRRAYLVSKGFKMFCGVGMDSYLHYFPDNVAMDRANIDGFRITHSPKLLKKYFDTAVIVDGDIKYQ